MPSKMPCSSTSVSSDLVANRRILAHELLDVAARLVEVVLRERPVPLLAGPPEVGPVPLDVHHDRRIRRDELPQRRHFLRQLVHGRQRRRPAAPFALLRRQRGKIHADQDSGDEQQYADDDVLRHDAPPVASLAQIRNRTSKRWLATPSSGRLSRFGCQLEHHGVDLAHHAVDETGHLIRGWLWRLSVRRRGRRCPFRPCRTPPPTAS